VSRALLRAAPAKQFLCAIRERGAQSLHRYIRALAYAPAHPAGAPRDFGSAIYLSLGAHLISLLELLLRKEGSGDVDLALRLNVVAVLAVFAFVAAVLLGAF
jgi:hypothetical protein